MTNERHDAPAADPALNLYQRVGELTRTLHDALRELGYDKQIEQAASSLPDARTRLSFIAEKTGDSAEKVLNIVDRAKADQERLHASAEEMEGSLKRDPVAAVASGRVMCFIQEVRRLSGETDSHLTDIMMAQDFHDLTGQVVKKVVDLATRLEEQLLKLLLDSTPPEQRSKVEQGWLNGPAMNAAQRDDVVSSQSQVDDLLESLGF